MKKIRVGIMPAAGIGKRLSNLPLTRILPKPLLPLINKPIMEYGIENMKRLGVEIVHIIVGSQNKLIKKYFGDGSEFGVDINYILQPNPSGIADAIELTRSYVDEPFCVVLGDDFTFSKSLDNLVNDFWTKKAKIIEGFVFEKDIEKIKLSCSITLNQHGEIIDIQEKPDIVTSEIRGCGIYICDPIVYDYISKTPVSSQRCEKEITNTLKLMAKEHVAYGSAINGKNININRLSDLIEAIELVRANACAV